ncbi:MAG: hypothetical protein HY769_10265 [Candidatus Stahlbacteria bacterium]|nr:hypothetical protein [Candidatus Stahlbacteria bacterium]
MEGLYKNGIRYLIVGGLSVNLYGVPRVTQDIDLIISIDKENILKIISLLKNLGYVPRLPVDSNDLVDSAKVRDWIETKNLKAFSFYHPKATYKVVDIILVHPLEFEEVFLNKTVKRVKDIEIYLASIDDIIEMKKFSARPQDFSDIEMLKKAKKYRESEK